MVIVFLHELPKNGLNEFYDMVHEDKLKWSTFINIIVIDFYIFCVGAI